VAGPDLTGNGCGAADTEKYTWYIYRKDGWQAQILLETDVEQLIEKNTCGIFTGRMGGRPRSENFR
jgi:hypothetical protein